jgi:hypothetical protein
MANSGQKKDCVIYYGPAITDKVWRERELPTINAPGSNRMMRLAPALQRGERRCFLVSPGIFPNILSKRGLFKPVLERHGGVCVFTVAQLRKRWLGFLLAPITAIRAAKRISQRHRIVEVVHYNFTPDGIMLSLWCKLMYRSKIVVDLEDINIPRWSDLLSAKRTRPIHQIAYWMARKISVFFSDAVIVPTRRFQAVIPRRKQVLIVSGCQPVKTTIETQSDNTLSISGKPIQMLLSGGTNPEYGATVIAEAVEEMARKQLIPKERLELIVSGKDRDDWLRNRLSQYNVIDMRFTGFLKTEAFRSMYKDVDLCFALMNPQGREGQFKTPSKGYEAICSGKALIVSDVGDFDLLPDTVCIHLKEYNGSTLARILSSLTWEKVENLKINAQKYAADNFDTAIVRENIRKAGL